MKEEKTKKIWDAEYKCRRCDERFTDGREDKTYGLPFPNFIEHLYWSRPDREIILKRVAHLMGYPESKIGEIDCIPDPVTIHICPDGGRGIADLIGMVNPREIKRCGRGWKLA